MHPHNHKHRVKVIAISAPLYYVVGADTCLNKFGCNKFIPIRRCKANCTILVWITWVGEVLG